MTYPAGTGALEEGHLASIDTNIGTLAANPASVSDLNTTGTISAAQSSINTPVSNATVVLATGKGQSSWKAQLVNGGGGFTSGTTIVADKSLDGGTTWYSASFKVTGASPATTVSSVVGPGPIELTGNASGVSHVRIRCSVLNSTETIAVTLRASTGVGDIGLMSSIPAGSNTIGGVNVVDSAGTNKLTVNSGGAASVSQSAATSTSGTLQNAQAGSAVGTPLTVLGMSSAVWTVNMSNFTGTVNFEGSEDGTNFSSLSVTQLGTVTIASTATGSSTTSIRVYECSVGGLQSIQARTSSVSGGTVTVTAHAVPVNFAPRNVNATLQTGTNTIGNVNVIMPTSATGTPTSVAAAISSTSLLASNTSRLGAYFFNDSTAILYLLLNGGTASTTNYTVQVPPNGFFELPTTPVYTGAIRGIWSAATGAVRITELT